MPTSIEEGSKKYFHKSKDTFIMDMEYFIKSSLKFLEAPDKWTSLALNTNIKKKLS